MVWTVVCTNVESTERQHGDNLTTEEVYTFIFNALPTMSPEVTKRLWLDLVATGEATLGIYQFAASAAE